MNLQRKGRSAVQPFYCLHCSHHAWPPASPPVPSHPSNNCQLPTLLCALHKLLKNDDETFKFSLFGPGNSLSASFPYTHGKQNHMCQQDPDKSSRTRLVDAKGDMQQYMSMCHCWNTLHLLNGPFGHALALKAAKGNAASPWIKTAGAWRWILRSHIAYHGAAALSSWIDTVCSYYCKMGNCM